MKVIFDAFEMALLKRNAGHAAGLGTTDCASAAQGCEISKQKTRDVLTLESESSTFCFHNNLAL